MGKFFYKRPNFICNTHYHWLAITLSSGSGHHEVICLNKVNISFLFKISISDVKISKYGLYCLFLKNMNYSTERDITNVTFKFFIQIFGAPLTLGVISFNIFIYLC